MTLNCFLRKTSSSAGKRSSGKRPQDKATLRCDVPSGTTIRSNPLILAGILIRHGKVPRRRAHSLLRQITVSPIPWQSQLKRWLQLCLNHGYAESGCWAMLWTSEQKYKQNSLVFLTYFLGDWGLKQVECTSTRSTWSLHDVSVHVFNLYWQYNKHFFFLLEHASNWPSRAALSEGSTGHQA